MPFMPMKGDRKSWQISVFLVSLHMSFHTPMFSQNNRLLKSLPDPKILALSELVRGYGWYEPS